MSARRRRFIPELILIAVVCALVARFSAPAPARKAEPSIYPDPPPPPATRSPWSVDEVTPGMTYEEVVGKLGLPARIHRHRQGWLSLEWGVERDVYFNRGIAYACWGRRIYHGTNRIEVGGYDQDALEKLLGKGQKSGWITSWWWPNVHIGNTYGGRFLLLAPAIDEPNLGNNGTAIYPWTDRYLASWQVDGLTPGTRPAGNHRNPEVQVSRSGFITEATGDELLLRAQLGQRNLDEGPFRVGEPVAKLKYWTPANASPDHFFCDDGQVEVESNDGTITKFRLHLNQPELIEVLDRHAR